MAGYRLNEEEVRLEAERIMSLVFTPLDKLLISRKARELLFLKLSGALRRARLTSKEIEKLAISHRHNEAADYLITLWLNRAYKSAARIWLRRITFHRLRLELLKLFQRVSESYIAAQFDFVKTYIRNGLLEEEYLGRFVSMKRLKKEALG